MQSFDFRVLSDELCAVVGEFVQTTRHLSDVASAGKSIQHRVRVPLVETSLLSDVVRIRPALGEDRENIPVALIEFNHIGNCSTRGLRMCTGWTLLRITLNLRSKD